MPLQDGQEVPRRVELGSARLLVLVAAALSGLLALGAAEAVEGPDQASRHRSAPRTAAANPPTQTSAYQAPATTSSPPTTGVPSPAAESVQGETFVPDGPWTPTAGVVAGQPAAAVTGFRPAGGGPRVAVLRLDTSLVRIVLYAGTTQPGGSWSSQGFVGPALQASLVAAFNGGFQFKDSSGWYADGRVGSPLRAGAASLVIHADGSATVGQWGRDASLGPDVVAVRQNLTLLVDAGMAVPTAAHPALWGLTLPRIARTWRSAVGDDGHGNLLYVGGPGLDPAGLAAVALGAGARRAMEFDINPLFVLGVTFASGAASATTVPTKLLAGMHYPADHFVTPNWRDFVVAFARPRPARSLT
jgi:hypothetical protein